MKKIIFTFFAIVILNVLPLIFVPELIYNYKSIILIIVAAILWLSQPAFSKEEMYAERSSDNFSIFFILIASCLSVAFSIIEWGYFTQNKSEINFVSIVGLIMLFGGSFIRVWSIYLLGRNFTATVKITKKHELISKGPYKIIRHPSYLGAMIAIVGCSLFLNNIISGFFSFAIMMGAYINRIKIEEKTLENYFGNSYKEYKRNTYRFLPYIW